MVAVYGESLTELLGRLFKKYGKMVGAQTNLDLSPGISRRLNELIKNPPDQVGRRRVVSVETMDGLKLVFSGDSWLTLRFSGTEPVIRCYSEAETRREAQALLKLGVRLLC